MQARFRILLHDYCLINYTKKCKISDTRIPIFKMEIDNSLKLTTTKLQEVFFTRIISSHTYDFMIVDEMQLFKITVITYIIPTFSLSLSLASCMILHFWLLVCQHIFLACLYLTSFLNIQLLYNHFYNLWIIFQRTCRHNFQTIPNILIHNLVSFCDPALLWTYNWYSLSNS